MTTIKCSVCKKDKGTTKSRLKKLKKLAGGKKKLLASYVCRECRRTTVPRKKQKFAYTKLVCSKCHKRYGSTRARTEKLISQYGGKKELQAKYVCRDCRREHNLDKRGLPKPVRKKRHKKRYTGNLPGHMRTFIRRREVAALDHAVATCFRPDIYLGQKGTPAGYCNNCAHFDACCLDYKRVWDGKSKPKRRKRKYRKRKTSEENESK